MLNVYKYQIPFRTPFITAKSTYNFRAGMLLCFEEDGYFFWGEAAPLPEFSNESLDDLHSNLDSGLPAIRSFFTGSFSLDELTQFVDSISSVPSLQFALSWMGLSLLSHRKNCTPGHLFGIGESPDIRVNDVIAHNDSEKWIPAINESVAKGFTCIKIKALYPVDLLASYLNAVKRRNNEIIFRLDANQSWPKNEAAQINRQLRNLPIEYIEEPFLSREKGFAENGNPFDFPVALDESIINHTKFETALKHPGQIIILKPSLLGNICKWMGTIQKYRSSFNNIVITTALESAIGRIAVTEIARLIGCRFRSHGLNTGKFFRDDLFIVPEISDGRIILPLPDLKSKAPEHLNRVYLSLPDF